MDSRPSVRYKLILSIGSGYHGLRANPFIFIARFYHKHHSQNWTLSKCDIAYISDGLVPSIKRRLVITKLNFPPKSEATFCASNSSVALWYNGRLEIPCHHPTHTTLTSTAIIWKGDKVAPALCALSCAYNFIARASRTQRELNHSALTLNWLIFGSHPYSLLLKGAQPSVQEDMQWS